MTTMTEPPDRAALDVRTFLLGDEGVTALRQRLAEALDSADDEPLAALPASARRALDEELAEIAARFLDIDLGATAMAGWRCHEELLEAARTTRARPDHTVCVPLSTHTMTSTWTPRVEVLLGRKAVGKITFGVEVSFTIVGLHATVTDARLTRLGGGSGTVSACLCVGGRRVVRREAPFDACTSVPLGRGMPLLGPVEPSTAPSVVEAPAQEPGRTARRRPGRLRSLRRCVPLPKWVSSSGAASEVRSGLQPPYPEGPRPGPRT